MNYDTTILRERLVARFGESDTATLEQHYPFPSSFYYIGRRLLLGHETLSRALQNDIKSLLTPFNFETDAATENEEKHKENEESLIKCRKCGSNTSFYQLQTRGGDEQMTVFINCLNMACGAKYKN